MNSMELHYPIKFTPILKEKIWGGDKLHKLFGKEKKPSTGESWEISGVNGSVSIIENGFLKGKTLTQAINQYKADFVGEKVFRAFGKTFPLLFKLIDASQYLSVQLHPNDAIAKDKHNSFGKTEMWYILNAEQDSQIIVGLKEGTTLEDYNSNLKAHTLKEILQFEKVKEGDSFFIAPGTVHAIGEGIVLAEIQQTSDITYRIYDWNRKDLSGNYRTLHTELALDAINFKAAHPKLKETNLGDNQYEVCKSSYFNTLRLEVTEPITRDISVLDSFVVYMCISGTAEIQIGIQKEHIHKGETLLIPAVVQQVVINSKKASFLEVSIP